MINKVTLYFKLQFKLITSLTILCIIPLWSFYQFSSFNVDYLYMVFFALLFIVRLLQPKEAHYRKVIKNRIVNRLEKELNQRPNTNQIIKRSNEYVESRDFAIIFTGAIIFLITIYFGKL
jgi:short subunit fatty acids transporter